MKITIKKLLIIFFAIPTLFYSSVSDAAEYKSILDIQELEDIIEKRIKPFHEDHLRLTNKLLGRYKLTSSAFILIGSSPAVVGQYLRSLGAEVYYFPTSKFQTSFLDSNLKLYEYSPQRIANTFAVNIERQIPNIHELNKQLVIVDYVDTGGSIGLIHKAFELGLKELGLPKNRTKVQVALYTSITNLIPRIGTLFNLPYLRKNIFAVPYSLGASYAERKFSAFSKYGSFDIMIGAEKHNYMKKFGYPLPKTDANGFALPVESPQMTEALFNVTEKLIEANEGGFKNTIIRSCRKLLF